MYVEAENVMIPLASSDVVVAVELSTTNGTTGREVGIVSYSSVSMLKGVVENPIVGLLNNAELPKTTEPTIEPTPAEAVMVIVVVY